MKDQLEQSTSTTNRLERELDELKRTGGEESKSGLEELERERREVRSLKDQLEQSTSTTNRLEHELDELNKLCGSRGVEIEEQETRFI